MKIGEHYTNTSHQQQLILFHLQDKPLDTKSEVGIENEIIISRSAGGFQNTGLTEWSTNFLSIVKELSQPAISAKNGSYFIRCNGTKRSNATVSKVAGVLILDGDSRIINNKGEIRSGAPDPADVHQILSKLGVSHLIYSSHSNGATYGELSAKAIDSDGVYGADYHKYRVVIPCRYTPEQLPCLLDYLFHELHQVDVMLAPVTENLTWSQPWYFPRVPDEQRLKMFRFYQYEGRSLAVNQICSNWQAQQLPQLQQPIKPEPKPKPKPKPIQLPQRAHYEINCLINPIAEFNRMNSIDDVLIRNGYIKKGTRYLRPGSQSNIAGVQNCLNSKDGVERIYSHGGDVLNDGFAHDAFDCYRLLECGGDWEKAFNWNSEITKHNQRLYIREQAKKCAESLIGKELMVGRYESQEKSEIQSFQLIPIKSLIENPMPISWMIKRLIESGSVNLFSGPYASGKSFVLFDLAFCVATGHDWHDHKVTQAPVVILAGEGHSGIANRFSALEIKYDIPCPEQLHVSQAPARLMDSTNARWVGEAVNQICPTAGLVIIDTLNRNFGGGDENSTKDMTQFINSIDDHFRATGKTVIIVHHTGHADSGRARGSSSLPGACEGEFIVEKRDNGLALICNKQKNAAKTKPMQFKFKHIELAGQSDDGEQVSSLVLECVGEGSSIGNKRQLKIRDELILTSLVGSIAEHGIDPMPEIKASFSGSDELLGKLKKVVHIDHWRNAVYPRLDAETSDARQKAFKRSRDKLFELGKICNWNDYWWAV